MCTGITASASVFGSGKGPEGWFKVEQVNVSFDHPYHLPLEHSLNIDFVNPSKGLGARIGVELTPDSARELIRLISASLERGEKEKVDPGLPAYLKH